MIARGSPTATSRRSPGLFLPVFPLHEVQQMKKLRAALMVAALSVSMTAIAHAQDAQPQGQRGGGRGVQALLQGITLTAAQQPKVDSLIKKFDADNQALRAEMQNG